MTVVRVAGQSLGRDTDALGPPRRLGKVKQVPTHRLLHPQRISNRVLEGDVGPVPEAIQTAPLRGGQSLESFTRHPVERALTPGDQVRR